MLKSTYSRELGVVGVPIYDRKRERVTTLTSSLFTFLRGLLWRTLTFTSVHRNRLKPTTWTGRRDSKVLTITAKTVVLQVRYDCEFVVSTLTGAVFLPPSSAVPIVFQYTDKCFVAYTQRKFCPVNYLNMYKSSLHVQSVPFGTKDLWNFVRR